MGSQPNDILYRNKEVIILKLTHGRHTIMDTEDYEKIKHIRWHAAHDPLVGSYYVHGSIYTPTRRIYCLHREILNVIDKRLKVDHINHDTLDNRKINLRVCTHAQNLCNRPIQCNNTSGCKGVSWAKSSKKWVVRIGVNGIRMRLGVYTDKKEAIRVYQEAAKRYHGVFRYGINVPHSLKIMENIRGTI